VDECKPLPLLALGVRVRVRQRHQVQPRLRRHRLKPKLVDGLERGGGDAQADVALLLRPVDALVPGAYTRSLDSST